MTDILLQTLAAFIGTVTFAALFYSPFKEYVPSGIVGAAGWFTYACCHLHFSAAVSSFFGAIIIVILARMIAVARKVPTNVYMVSGLFPLVPGVGIYHTLLGLLIGDPTEAFIEGVGVLKVAAAIVLAVIIVFSLPNKIFRREEKLRSRNIN